MLAVVLAATLAGGQWFAGFLAVAVVPVILEFSAITRPSLPHGFAAAMLVLGIAIIGAWFALGPAWGLRLAGLAILLLALAQYAVHRKLWAATGLAYAALPFFALTLLRGDILPGLHAVLFVFACVFATDTFAYFAGRAIGGPKLAPSISPKKTWAGFVGGLAGSIIVALAVMVMVGHRPTIAMALAAAGLSLASQMGDLFESWIKRRFGKKDSGALIPGHGGLLDRVDGLIFASVAAWIAAMSVSKAGLSPGLAGAGLIDAIAAP
jgi:phosphatidate cytidylyltransferase